MKEVFILGDDDALVASGVLAKIGIGGFRKADVKDVLTVHALLAERRPGLAAFERVWPKLEASLKAGERVIEIR